MGAVSYCTNVPPGYPSPDENEYVASQAAQLFQERLKQSLYAEDLGIVRIEYEAACIITIVTIGATLAGLYKLIADNEKFKSGLSKLSEDLNGVYVRIKRSVEKKGSTYVIKLNFPNKRILEIALKKLKIKKFDP